MLEFIYRKLKKAARHVDMYLERSKYGYIEKLPEGIEYPEGGLYDVVYESSCKWAHNVAVTYYNTDITYRELVKKIDRVARALKQIGVQKGDRVTICMPNTPEEIYMFYAVNEIGAVANMVHPLSSEKEIEECVNRAESKTMLVIDISYGKVERIIKNTNLEHVIVVSATRSMDFLVRALYYLTKGRKNHIKKTQQVIPWDKFLRGATKYVGNPHVRVNATDPAVILYSGGTTGKPKGVVLTNLNFNAQALGARYLVPDLLKSRYTMLSFLPNFHAFGLGVCMHIPFYCGMRIVPIPQFNAKKLRSYIRKYRINILVGVPTVFEYMTKIKFGKNELKNIKGVVSGGDIVSHATKQEFNQFLKEHGSHAMLHNGYGLTEAAGGMVFSPASIARGDGVIGFPLPDSAVVICDPKTLKPVKTGENGEILVRGLTVMKEYLGEPEETKKTFVKVQGKKYLRTGDLGYVDERGIVYFRSRLKRVIITNGYNVYPTHIEDVTRKCKLVFACTAVGQSDDLRGQKVVVFIVLKQDASERTCRKELTTLYKQYLAKYEIPREIRFLDELPKTKLAKVDFTKLERM